MKKLILLAAIGVAGLVSAKSIDGETLKKEVTQAGKSFNDQKETLKSHALLYAWYRVTSPCGSVYYLDLDQYTDDYSGYVDFISDIGYFNAQKCNGDTGLDAMFP